MTKKFGKFAIQLRGPSFVYEENRDWQFSLSIGSDKKVYVGFLFTFFRYGIAGWILK